MVDGSELQQTKFTISQISISPELTGIDESTTLIWLKLKATPMDEECGHIEIVASFNQEKILNGLIRKGLYFIAAKSGEVTFSVSQGELLFFQQPRSLL